MTACGTRAKLVGRHNPLPGNGHHVSLLLPNGAIRVNRRLGGRQYRQHDPQRSVVDRVHAGRPRELVRLVGAGLGLGSQWQPGRRRSPTVAWARRQSGSSVGPTASARPCGCRQGSPELRWALYEAAAEVRHRSSPPAPRSPLPGGSIAGNPNCVCQATARHSGRQAAVPRCPIRPSAGPHGSHVVRRSVAPPCSSGRSTG